ncbi:MAG: hypothetical protein LBB85_12620 [Dysgonamonadaceae bacterium]|nr:hypothetical protein [Dysgonamonadaceae bacterium]
MPKILGTTNPVAFLSRLQMGFRSRAIERKLRIGTELPAEKRSNLSAKLSK